MIKRDDKVDSRLLGNDGEKKDSGQAGMTGINSMIKRILIIAIVALALLMGTSMYAQKPEKKETKEPKGPRIVLEEVEVTLYENGKEIERKKVTRKEKLKIFDEVNKKAFQRTLDKLGLKSGKEMYEKKLEGKYHEELKNSYSEKKLDKPRIKVIDEKGNVLKEISLATEKNKIKIRDKRLKKDWDGVREIRRTPIASDNKMFGAVVANTNEKPVLTDEYLKVNPEYEGTPSTGQITVFDNWGEVLFEKQYPKGIGVNESIFADNGTVVVVTGVGAEEYRLHVYDKSGREILVYPKEQKYIPIFVLNISPNGKYLAAEIWNTVFFNTSTGAVWKANKSYVINDMSNSGIVKVVEGYELVDIDLKEHLGE